MFPCELGEVVSMVKAGGALVAEQDGENLRGDWEASKRYQGLSATVSCPLEMGESSKGGGYVGAQIPVW